MTPPDEPVDIDLPFVHVHVGGGRTRVRFGDEEEVIDMEADDSGEYWAVRRRVRDRLRFFRHVFTFVAANTLFFVIDWGTGGGFWVQWVALIWGAFLAWEFVSKFLAPALWGREAEERMVQRELRRRRGV